MPTGIAASDKKLLLGGGAVMALLLLAIVFLSPPQEQLQSPVPSTYSSQSAGAEAAYRLLTTLHYPVRRWESPPTELPDDPSGTLLVLAGPYQPPSEKERKALAEFVEKGGHVLFTGGAIRSYFPEAELSNQSPEPGWKSFAPVLPTRVTKGARKISLGPQAYWKELSPEQFQLYGYNGEPVVVSWLRGKGSILWWAGSTPLSNAGITKDDNLTFFLNSVGDWREHQPYSIYWDEYFHGQRNSLLGYVGKTSLAWSGLQLGLIVVAVLWTFSRRSGPVFVPPQTSRLSPLEFVDTLGGLYERAGAAPSAVAITAMRLRALLARQLGLPVNSSNDEFAEAARARLGWKDAGLGVALAKADEAARAQKVYPQAALDLVRKLEEFTARLDLRSQIRREKR